MADDTTVGRARLGTRRKHRLRIEPFALPPLVFVQEHGPEFGEPVGWVFERAEDDRAFVDREREQRDAVVAAISSRCASASPPVALTVSARSATAPGATGIPASITDRVSGKERRGA